MGLSLKPIWWALLFYSTDSDQWQRNLWRLWVAILNIFHWELHVLNFAIELDDSIILFIECIFNGKFFIVSTYLLLWNSLYKGSLKGSTRLIGLYWAVSGFNQWNHKRGLDCRNTIISVITKKTGFWVTESHQWMLLLGWFANLLLHSLFFYF